MKFYLSIFCFVSIAVSAMATTPTSVAIADYVQKHNEIAVKEMKRSGIPASILLAQAILASEHGTSPLSLDHNNHFAIKCGLGWTGETQFSKEQESISADCFRAYDDTEKSFEDYTNILMETKSCRNLFQYSYYDYKSWANGMQACMHADEKQYAAKLIKLIEKYQLTKFDSPETFSPAIVVPIIGYEYEIN